MAHEIRLAARRYPDAQISTVFLGGGTPTLVPASSMEKVLDALRESFVFLPDAEFTSEGNPGTITAEWLDMALSRGLNRLSLGVQASQDRLLKAIGRIHTFDEAVSAVSLARQCGVQNLNLDAMFGLPGQSESDYLDTLRALCSLKPEHLSAYSLILEEGTPLYDAVENGQLHLPDEDEAGSMYENGIAFLERSGYARYEISNFARPGFACRHNLGYWQGAWYLGMGVAAHSMLPPDDEARSRGAVRIRRGNGTDVNAYIRALLSGAPAPADETAYVPPEEAMFETMMLGLRTTAGVTEALFRSLHSTEMNAVYGPAIAGLIRDGLGTWRLQPDGTRAFALTPRGLEMQNEVLLRLMD